MPSRWRPELQTALPSPPLLSPPYNAEHASSPCDPVSCLCRCNVSLLEVRWLGMVAFYRVLRRKQTQYKAVLAALRVRR